MNKVKKILVSIIIVSIAILGLCNISNAYYSVNGLKVGDERNITFNEYENNSNIFCMERGQSLRTNNYYKVVSNVKIQGTKSTDHTGKTIDNPINASFSYILWKSKSTRKSTVSNAVWNFGYLWMNRIGRYHAGLYQGFASTVTGKYSPINREAQNYANNLQKTKSTKAQDKTDKSKIAVQTVTKNNVNYYRVGPFNWTFGGSLSDMKAYDQNGNVINNIICSTFKGNKEVNITKFSDITSGKPFYVSVPVNSGVSKITKLTGKVDISEKTANIWFLESEERYKQNLIIVEPGETTEKIDVTFNYDIKLQGSLKVIKVVKGNETIKLQNVGFIIQNSDTNKYVALNDKNEIIYVDKKEDAHKYSTDANGEITINNLMVGNYTAYETENPNHGYEIIQDGIPTKVVVDKTEELKIPNKQKYIKLSGYVWVDRISGKQSTRNNLYKDGEYDANDILLDGIKVRLKDRTTNNIVKETTTSNGGAYQFEDVLVDDLEKYYIEFEYDGLTYQNVPAMLDKENGSKSAENGAMRTEFNNGFAFIEGETENTGVAKDLNGNAKHQLSYSRSENKSILNKGDYPINATTDEASYSIKDHYTVGQEEIKYINLGLYEREMADIRLEKDVENVELSINGFSHVYEYGSKKLDNYSMEKDDNGFNVGVKFASEYKGTYKRAVYEPDYNYTLQNSDKDNKLNVYLTYRIAMYNEATNLKTKVNSILDYYDKNFTLVKIGTNINKETGEITGDEIAVPQVSQQGDYNKVVIQNNTEIEPGKTMSIYVRFKLSDSEVLKAFNDDRDGNVTYKNIAEVNSYSVYDNEGKVYAGIDKDSAPANATPGNETTYEDDTNNAPGIQLDVQGNRTIQGSVFLDESTGGVAQVRLGDGIYDSNKEHGIKDVKVTLTENKEGGQIYNATTDENGNFTISDFIPGNYTLTYTWGDKTYNVKDYKGTIWTENNRNEKEQNGNNWYKVNTETRYSDAMDDYSMRQKMDNGENITTMNSSTPTMSLGCEINSVYSTVSDVDRFVPEGYEIKNIDFGIVERARQQLDIAKKVKTFKVTLANGQVVVDAEIDENGELKGSKNNLTYMRPGTSTPSNGQLWLQLDSELIQGANAEVQYEIKVINNSELDYNTEGYYKYGTDRNNVITITPTGVYDYLDGMTIDTDKDNGNWKVISKEEYNNKYNDPTIVEKYFNDNKNTITDENGANISRWNVASKTYQDVYTKWIYEVTESKTVRDVKLNNIFILHNEDLEKELVPGSENKVNLNTATKLSNSNEIDLNNSAEITEYRKNTNAGKDIDIASSQLITPAEEITITPPTGENNNILIIVTAISALVLLGIGVVLIKRKTL